VDGEKSLQIGLAASDTVRGKEFFLAWGHRGSCLGQGRESCSSGTAQSPSGYNTKVLLTGSGLGRMLHEWGEV